MDREPPFGPALTVGGWTVHPDRNEIESGGLTARVEPMTMRLLLLLIENGARTTSRDDIVDRLWDGRIVSEDAITKQISKLRAALGDDPRRPRIIRTIPKVGVRLIAAPEAEPAAGAEPRRGRGIPWWAIPAALALLVAGSILWLRSGREEIHLTQSPLTSAPGLEQDPAVSPDGRWLAYVAQASGAEAALYVRTLDNETVRRVSPPGAAPHSPAWSAGGRLAFVVARADGCAILAGSVFGPYREVARCGAALGLSWLGEDRLVVAVHPRLGETFRLATVDLATGAIRPITAPPAGAIGDRSPAVSADGGKVYFARSLTVGVEHVLELDLASGRIRSVAEESAHILGLAIGGSGRLLVASNRGSGTMGLWRLEIATGVWRQLLPEVSGVPSASSDGSRIVFARTESRTSLWRQALTGNGSGAISETTRADWSPVAATDGALAFLSSRTGARELWRLAPGGGEPEQVSRFNGPEIQDPAWSPDTRTIAVAVPKENNFDIYFVDAHSGAARRITAGAPDDRHPAFSPDGRLLYFARREGAGYALIRREIGSGRESRIQGVGLRALPSGDGRSLYFGRLFVPGLFALALDTGNVRQVTPWPSWDDMRNWTVADGMIWGVAREPGNRPMLMRFDPASNRARPIVELPALAQSSGLTIRGGDAIYTRRLGLEADLILLRLEADSSRF